MDEKFDPNVLEDIFIILESEQDYNTVGVVMQIGWKIGERILRVTKVGIIKKASK
jgi:molecular chaperone GrpE (heat shock protein)